MTMLDGYGGNDRDSATNPERISGIQTNHNESAFADWLTTYTGLESAVLGDSELTR